MTRSTSTATGRSPRPSCRRAPRRALAQASTDPNPDPNADPNPIANPTLTLTLLTLTLTLTLTQAHLKESSYSEAAVGAILSNPPHPIPSSRPIADPTLPLTLTPSPDPTRTRSLTLALTLTLTLTRWARSSTPLMSTTTASSRERSGSMLKPPRLTPRPAQHQGDVEP